MSDLALPTQQEARALTDRIKVAVDGTWLLIQEAYVSRTWAVLGYASWDTYCNEEFDTARLALPKEDRREVVASLRESGLSLRAIEAATGIDKQTANRLLGAGVSPSLRNETPAVSPVRGIDGKTYSAQRPMTMTASISPQPMAEYMAQTMPEILDAEVFDDEPPADPWAQSTPMPAPTPRPAPVMLKLRTNTGAEVDYPQPASKATFNETTGDGISWASWSWNPVTGCLHGCTYCYARAIANRFTDGFPAGFTPLFHHERLDAPANTTIPGARRDVSHADCDDGDCRICAYRRVFVCSMADLYGRWVPDEWIDQVHASMLATPAWQYILLTKFPSRYVGLDLPQGAWVGTSVDEQKRVRIAEDAFRNIDGVKVKWLSLEPLLEPLEFTDLSIFDWVVIGAQTETRQPDGVVPAFDPPPAWVIRITHQALEAGCKVHWKPNLRRSLWLNEYPISK